MKRKAQLRCPTVRQYALDQDRQVLRYLEDLLRVAIRNTLSDLHKYHSCCETYWVQEREKPIFPVQAVPSAFLIRFQEYLQTPLHLKRLTRYRTFIILNRPVAWTRKTPRIQSDSVHPITRMSDEATPSRSLRDEREEVLVATVTTIVTCRGVPIIGFVYHPGVCLTHQFIHRSKRSGTAWVIGQRKNVYKLPLHTPVRPVVNQNMEILPQKYWYFFPPERAHYTRTGQVLKHLEITCTTRSHITDSSSHTLHHHDSYWLVAVVSLYRLTQIIENSWLDSRMLSLLGARQSLQQENIAWI